MTPEELQAIRDRVNNASPGPWEHLTPRNTNNHAVVDSYGEDLANDYEGVWYSEEDAEFIAHARTDIPALLDHIDTLTARLEAVQELHREGRNSCCAGVYLFCGLLVVLIGAYYYYENKWK